MKIPFVKYQGTGNDFVILDQRVHRYVERGEIKKIAFLCDRRFGIGADGLMLLEPSINQAFEMIYFNADGNESTMCGNGGRCIAHYARHLGLFDKETTFKAIDGDHEVKLEDDIVFLKMCDVDTLNKVEKNIFTLNTGSPHYVQLMENLPESVTDAGRKIRNSTEYKKEGINVNFLMYDQVKKETFVATYERGVEEETLSCGTGVTAAALVCGELLHVSSPVTVNTKGGQLKVFFQKVNNGYSDIWLSGPATFVFSGEIDYFE